MGDEDGQEPVIDTNVVSVGQPKAQDEPELDADGNPILLDDDDDDDEHSNMSLAAMEATLKPQVLEILERIAFDYSKLSEMQDLRISATLNEDGSFTDEDENTYQALRSEIVELVNELHLHNNRIEALIDHFTGSTAASCRLTVQWLNWRIRYVSTGANLSMNTRQRIDPNWLDRWRENQGAMADVHRTLF